MIHEIHHPIQYSEIIEEQMSGVSEWYIEKVPEVMVSDKRSSQYEYFYNLFFPIFSESYLENKIEYTDYNIYLINHSKNKNNIILPQSTFPKIVYFVNNSNAKLKLEDREISLTDKKGKSIFVDSVNEIILTRSNVVQTCILVLNLVKKFKDKKILYN